MISPLRATILLGGASVVSLAVGVISAKVYAVLLGPSGVGLYGLQLSILNLGVLVAGLGVGAALVRELASRIAVDDVAGVAALRRGALLTTACAGAGAVTFMVLAREPLSETLLGTTSRQRDVVIVGIALVGTLLSGVYVATLNGYHRVAILARVSIISSLFGGALSIAVVVAMGQDGLAVGLLLGALVSLAVAAMTVWSTAPIPGGQVSVTAARSAAASLLRFGVPYAASQVVGTGAQLLVPVIVLATLTQEAVGQYRAASAIAIGYLAFLLNAMAQDYYPRLSAAALQPAALGALVEQQLRLIMRLSVPVIFAALAVAPLLVQVLYSAEFAGATEVLRWQLTGDLLKLPAWTVSFVLLARGASRSFFSIELLGGVGLLVLTLIGLRYADLAGAGLAYLAMYVLYYPLALGAAWRIAGIRISWTFLLPPMLAAVASIAVVIGDAAGALTAAILLGGLAAAAGIISAIGILKDRAPGRRHS